jgi:hypothetical protein
LARLKTSSLNGGKHPCIVEGGYAASRHISLQFVRSCCSGTRSSWKARITRCRCSASFPSFIPLPEKNEGDYHALVRGRHFASNFTVLEFFLINYRVSSHVLNRPGSGPGTSPHPSKELDITNNPNLDAFQNKHRRNTGGLQSSSLTCGEFR